MTGLCIFTAFNKTSFRYSLFALASIFLFCLGILAWKHKFGEHTILGKKNLLYLEWPIPIFGLISPTVFLPESRRPANVSTPFKMINQVSNFLLFKCDLSQLILEILQRLLRQLLVKIFVYEYLQRGGVKTQVQFFFQWSYDKKEKKNRKENIFYKGSNNELLDTNYESFSLKWLN